MYAGGNSRTRQRGNTNPLSGSQRIYRNPPWEIPETTSLQGQPSYQTAGKLMEM